MMRTKDKGGKKELLITINCCFTEHLLYLHNAPPYHEAKHVFHLSFSSYSLCQMKVGSQ